MVSYRKFSAFKNATNHTQTVIANYEPNLIIKEMNQKQDTIKVQLISNEYKVHKNLENIIVIEQTEKTENPKEFKTVARENKLN